MNAIMNEKGRQTKLLAAIAIIAMVVCAFAVVMPSEDVEGAPTAGAINTPTLVTADTVITSVDANYIVGETPLTINANITGSSTNAIYLLPGATVTISAGTVGTDGIMVYNATAGSTTGTYNTNAYGVTLPAGAVIATGGVTITNDATNGMTISGAVTSGNITMTNVTVGENGFLDSDDTTANTGLDFAYATLVTGSGITYSATTENVVFEDNNDTKVDKVIVKSPSAAMTVTYNYGDAGAAETTVIEFGADLATVAGITITGSTTAATAPTIGGTYTAGSITIQSGSATTVSGFGPSADGIFNAYAEGDITTGKDVAATVNDLGDPNPATVYVYGSVQANQSLVNASPSVTIQAGSSVQNLTLATSSATVGVFSLTNNGTAAITVSLSGTAIKVPAIATGVSMTLVSGTFTATALSVAAEGTLTVANGATLTVPATGAIDGNFYIAGTLDTADTSLITINKTGRFIAMGGATVPTDKITISGTGYIDFSGMAGTENVSGSITGSRDYGQAQNVNVIGNWEVKNNAYVIIRGDFIVNENVTVTIRAGSQIVIVGDTSKMDISGTLNIEAGASFVVVKSENTEISGTVNNNGAFYINKGTVEALEGGIVNSRGSADATVTYPALPAGITADPAIASVVAGITTIDGFEVASGANLNIYGDFNIAKISNKGTITFDNATATAASDITLAGNGAVVYIGSVGGLNASGTPVDLSITDGTNTITFADGNGTDSNPVQVADITIAGSVTVKDGKNIYAMDISGAPEVSYDGTTTTTPPTVNATLTVTGTKVTVSETLALGENITLNINGATEVSGTVTAMDNSSIIAVGNTGALTVTGMIQSRGTIGITSPGVVNAAHYTAKADNVTYNYYTTLATAITNEAKEIDILGTVTVTENLDIPAGVTVNAGNGLIIGDDDHRDITVVVKDGATLNGTNVTVNATLEFEDKTDNYVNTINSDVAVVGDVSSMYTNIYTALLGADEGDVVTVTKPVAEGAVILTSDLTVPTGVTLEVPISRTIQVNDGVTLTVDGTMRTTALLTEDNHGFSAVASEDKARLIVNGTFMSMDAVDYTTYQAAGAYYAITGSTYNYLTTVPLAAAAQNVSAGVIDIYGDVTVDSVAFTGTEEQALTVTLKAGSMVATTITLSRATFGVDAGAEFEGTIASAAGSIEIVNSGSFTVSDSVDDEDVETFAISGSPVKADANGADATIAIATGNVSVVGTLNVTGLSAFSIDSGATLTVTGQDGRFTASKMTIDGTLVSTDYGRVTVTDLIVMGTFTVEPSTTENGAGSATITNLYVGTSDKTEGNAAATVNGTFTPSKAVVAAAATVDERIIENLRNSTEIYVEGELYATAYASASNIYVDLSKVAVENADIVGWAETEGGETLLNGATSFNIGTYDDLYAIIDYNIYEVYVVAGNGIGTIAIDNIVLVKGAEVGANYYTVLGGLKAGTHTITYTLQTGYEGTSQITVNGTLQTGNTFECSGTDTADRVIYINLSDVTPVDISTGGSTDGGDDNGLGLTDYLLIVLVVLIVVMAIIVALRLMRS